MANNPISMQKIRQVLRCYAQGKGTKAMSSILSGFSIIGDKTVADAVLDRIVHQAVRIELCGESLRKKNV